MENKEKRVIDAAKGLTCTLRECVTGDFNCGVDIVTRDPVAARLIVDAITRLEKELAELAEEEGGWTGEFNAEAQRRKDGKGERKMSMTERRVRLRLKYWWRKACNAFGFCPCGSRVNWTTTGRPVCPQCGR